MSRYRNPALCSIVTATLGSILNPDRWLSASHSQNSVGCTERSDDLPRYGPEKWYSRERDIPEAELGS